MATLSQVRGERRKYFSQLLAVMKQLDGNQERVQRFLRSCLARKKGYIDIPDWQKVQSMFSAQVKSTNDFGSLLAKGFVV